MLRYTRCNIVILMAATAWLMLSFSSCIVCGFDSHTVLFKCNQRKSPPPGRDLRIYESNPHTIQELKDNISHAVAAIRITTLHRVYLTMTRRAQLCIDAGGNHFQHLLWWYILSAFGYCINFRIYAMLRTRATFSWPILYYNSNFYLRFHRTILITFHGGHNNTDWNTATYCSYFCPYMRLIEKLLLLLFLVSVNKTRKHIDRMWPARTNSITSVIIVISVTHFNTQPV